MYQSNFAFFKFKMPKSIERKSNQILKRLYYLMTVKNEIKSIKCGFKIEDERKIKEMMSTMKMQFILILVCL